VKLNPNYSRATLYLLGAWLILPPKGHPLQGATGKVFFSVKPGFPKRPSPSSGQLHNGRKRDYLYKFINSYNNHYVINMIYYKIQLSKTAYYNDSLIDSSFFTPND